MCFICLQDITVEVMLEKARELGVEGVCMALITAPGKPQPWKPSISYTGKFGRSADPLKGEGDTGANYLAVCLSKWAEGEDTGTDSGTTVNRVPKKGEFGYRGYVTKTSCGHTLKTSFSGGTQDQDVEIAQAGIEALEMMLPAYLMVQSTDEIVGVRINIGGFGLDPDRDANFEEATPEPGTGLRFFLKILGWLGLTLVYGKWLLGSLTPLVIAMGESKPPDEQLALGIVLLATFAVSMLLALLTLQLLLALGKKIVN